jgi:hypothetical protein
MTSEATDEITPQVLRTPRAAGLAGIVFAVLFGLIVVLLRRVVPADPHDAGAWLTKAGSRREIQLALGLVPLCGIFFLWFMGAVRSRIGETEDKFLATEFLGSGLLFIAMLFVFSALFGALIGVAGLHHGNPPLDIWQLGRATTFNLAATYAVRMAAVFMIVASTIAFRLRVHSRVVAGFGYAAAVLLLFGSSSIPWLMPVFLVWVLLVSINIVVLSSPHPGQARGKGARFRLSPSKTLRDYLRMFTARATTRIPTTTEIASSAIIMSFDHGLIAETSVGLNAIAALKERCR